MPTEQVGRARVVFLGTYVPRQCGIATFTNDLYQAVRACTSAPQLVVAINGPGATQFEYPDEVAFEMHRDRLDDYQRAAEFINFSDADVVCVQHEFGIFGGPGGSHLTRLLRNLRKPVVTALHTVLRKPESHYRTGLMGVANWSNLLVTMTRYGRQMLIENYGIDPARIEVIPHGSPELLVDTPEGLKARFDLSGRQVLLTFGLLGPGKGIETAIEAVAIAARKHPQITYLIVGATHPEVKRVQGEDYRIKLQRLANERGLRENVVFYNQYLSHGELVEFLRMCDIYLLPYPNLEQTASGTLSFALSQGNAIIATPFAHAREALADRRGVLVEPGNPGAMAEALLDLLDNHDKIDQYKAASLEYGRTTAWPKIGRKYARLFERVMDVYAQTIRVEQASRPIVSLDPVVEPKFDHMRRLTDDTGILQHAVCKTPDRSHGYCTDDNARAIQVALMNQDTLDELKMGHLTSRYFGFLHYAQRQDGRFHNFMNYQRQWLDDVGSDDCQGRAAWALGLAVAIMSDSLDRLLAKQMFDRAMPALGEITSPRARGYMMLGLCAYLQSYPDNADCRRALARHAAALADLYARIRVPGWSWFEESMTYANAKLPEAMLYAGAMLENAAYRTIGADTLDFLTEQVLEGDHLSLIGNSGWLSRGTTKAPFDQQPIDAAAMVSAYRMAAWVLDDDAYLVLARKALDWFFGANDMRISLYDFTNGGCYDGLMATGVNFNQGAESTLGCLRAISLMADPNDQRLS